MISKKIAYDSIIGTLGVGMRKVNMGYEQNMGDFDLLTTERSIATWFLPAPTPQPTRKRISDRAQSAYSGTAKSGRLKGLRTAFRSLAATLLKVPPRSLQTIRATIIFHFMRMSPTGIIFWYDNELSYKVGLNFGYANGGMVRTEGTNYINSEHWGINPLLYGKVQGL